MELKQIKELMAAMERAQIKKLSIKKEDFQIELERDSVVTSSHAFQSPMVEELDVHKAYALLANVKPGQSPLSPLVQEKVKESGPVSHPEEETSGVFVTSPLVGTFYASPSPDDLPYVKTGQKIEEGTVVCVIEAMKVMNEVKSKLSGVIVDVLVENGQPIEFGTKLFRLLVV